MDENVHPESYIYHMTPLENVSSILAEGVQSRHPRRRENIANDLTSLAAENGIDLPIDRRTCVFCYPTLSQAVSNLMPKRVDGEPNPFGDPEGIVVIDGEQVAHEMFVGEFKLISTAIDFQFREEPDEAMIAPSYDDALQQYAESLTRVSSFTEMETVCARFEYPEVVVAGDIEPAAIMSVLRNGHPLVQEYRRNE
jgi:hypothetical protein